MCFCLLCASHILVSTNKIIIKDDSRRIRWFVPPSGQSGHNGSYTIVFVATVVAADGVPALNMRCERICKRECKTNILATFAVGREVGEEYEGLTNAPDDECYDEHYLSDMALDKKEVCSTATKIARKYQVQSYSVLSYSF